MEDLRNYDFKSSLWHLSSFGRKVVSPSDLIARVRNASSIADVPMLEDGEDISPNFSLTVFLVVFFLTFHRTS